ncbi:MAG: efflux transporter outer membrane subunit [Burkholderiales bacterium]|nr:efflux transporter outer membrane subunit [Burkholderiales bacterium]
MRGAKMRGASLALAAFTVLAGCKVGPDYARPQVDTPAAFRYEVINAPDIVNTAWWEQFNDPVLNQLITTALAQNKDVRIAAARVEEAAGALGTTRSQLFPQVGAGADIARQEVSRFSGTNTLREDVNRTFTSYQALLSASWEIDFFGKLQRQTESARATLLATEDGRRATLLTLVAAVANEYVALCALDKQLEISRRTADSRGETVRLFELRYKGGVVAELEVEQARSEYEQALAAIPDLERLIVQQENLISALLGSNPGPIPRGKTLDNLTLPAVPAGLPSELLERRPDLLQAEQNLVAANAQIGAAKALYYPSSALTGQAGTLSTQWSKLFTADARVWNFGPTLNVPIFTAGAIRGQVAQAEARQQQAVYEYQQAIQTAFRETEDALVDQNKLREQLTVQARRVRALKAYARLARLRYDSGFTSFLEVLDAERSLFIAELDYTRNQGDLFQALVNIYKAMGGGWVVQASHLAPGPNLDVQANPPLLP